MNKSEKFWDKAANKFDKRASRFDETTAKTIAKVREYLRAGDIVLDYGCATGRITCELADHAKEIVGIDISAKMVEGVER